MFGAEPHYFDICGSSGLGCQPPMPAPPYNPKSHINGMNTRNFKVKWFLICLKFIVDRKINTENDTKYTKKAIRGSKSKIYITIGEGLKTLQVKFGTCLIHFLWQAGRTSLWVGSPGIMTPVPQGKQKQLFDLYHDQESKVTKCQSGAQREKWLIILRPPGKPAVFSGMWRISSYQSSPGNCFFF